MTKTALSVALSALLLTSGALYAQGSDVAALVSKADRGDPKAMVEVGKHFIARQETAKGVLYLEAAINKGGADAAYAHSALGRHYESLGIAPITRDAMMHHYRQAAILGDLESQTRLGILLLEEAKVTRGDVAKRGQLQGQAQMLLEHAAREGGLPAAAYTLGMALYTGDGLPKETANGLAWLRRAAERGHVTASYEVGKAALESGDSHNATANLLRAAEKGHGRAMLDLANGYATGDVITKDLVAAGKWASKAVDVRVVGADAVKAKVDAALAPSRLPVAVIASAPPAGATYTAPLNQPMTSAVAGSPMDQLRRENEELRSQISRITQILERMQANGAGQQAVATVAAPERPAKREKLTHNQRGLEAHKQGDFTTAFKQFISAASDNDVDGMNNLGMMYLQGQGIPSDGGRAMEYFRRAAEQGHVTAAFNIGYMYENGLGVKADMARSRVWLRHSSFLEAKEKRLSNMAVL